MTGPMWIRQRGSASGRRGSEGMTVIELTVAAAVLMIILVPVFAFLATAQRDQNTSSNATGQQADSRLVLQEMTRFLREAEYPQGATYATTNSNLFANDGAYHITFFSAVGAVQGTGTIDEVDYNLGSSGSTLTQTVTAPDSATCSSGSSNCYTGAGGVQTRTVLSDVVNQSLTGCTNITTAVPMFTYYEQDQSTGQLVLQGNTGTAESNYVTITAVVGPPSGQTGECTQVQTAVSLRNWRP
jgi:Tfp pilus assembly protein PilW